jgi:hypothetical protein
MFDFVNPLRSDRGLGYAGRDAEFNDALAASPAGWYATPRPPLLNLRGRLIAQRRD